MLRTPHLQAMILCDNIVRDEMTKKIYLLGTFTNIWAPQIPGILPQPVAIYFALSDAQGEYDIGIKIRHTETREVWHEHTFKVNIPNPLATAEVNLMIGGVRVNRDGKLDFELYANNVLIGMRQIFVTAAPPPHFPKPPQE
jgi:hypothetical protein